jgi:hypothetical protein
MVAEKPAKVSCRYGQPSTEVRFIAVVERAGDDQLHGTADQFRCVRGDVTDHPVRTAPETRSVACRLGRGSQLEGRDVLSAWSCAASGAAVDAGRPHRRVGGHAIGYTGLARDIWADSDVRPDPSTSRPDLARYSSRIR